MTSQIDQAGQRPRVRWRRWLPRILAVAMALVALTVGLVQLGVIDGPGAPTAAERSEAVKGELVQRMTTVLEQTPSAHEGHGGHVGAAAQASKTICGAQVYGYEPASAETADDVVTVYGFHMCAVAEPKLPWGGATKFVAPLIMRFDTDPPTVRAAASTATVTYRDAVKNLMPAKYLQQSLQLGLDPAPMADLRRRYDAAAEV